MSVQRDLLFRDPSQPVIGVGYRAVASVIGQTGHAVLSVIGEACGVLFLIRSHLLGKGSGKIMFVIQHRGGVHIIMLGEQYNQLLRAVCRLLLNNDLLVKKKLM